MDKELINKWLNEKVINTSQAKRMLADVERYKKESHSNKFIVAISTIGALLLGVGAILFIASNWEELSRIAKTLILVGSTGLAYYLGYFLKYQKQNLPKVGASLLFLGALLFGATIILVTQIYNVSSGDTHVLVLIWLIGILPLVYALGSVPIAGLASLLFYLWVGLFFSMDNDWWFFEFLGRFTLILFIAASIMLFATGGLHYIIPQFKQIARTYRIASLKVMMLSLFLLTFDWFSKLDKYDLEWFNKVQEQISVGIVIFSILAILISVINWFLNKSKELSVYEGPISIGLIGLILIFFFYPSQTSIYVLVFNLLFAALTLLFIYIGYNKEDIALVNSGIFWLAIFLVAKYFDWFWDLLERSTFFLTGGLILVLGGIALEKKRRQIKASFKKNE